jgi:hypothetical protein
MPARRRLPALAALLPLLLLLGGCWEVLSYQDQGDSDDLFMDTDGAVEVSPASLSLEASGGEDAKASLTFVETTGERGVEMVLALEGEAAGQLAVHPGELSVTLVPGGSLEIQVSFSPDGSTTDADAELVVTTTGTPAEMRIPIDTRLEPGDDDSAG